MLFTLRRNVALIALLGVLSPFLSFAQTLTDLGTVDATAVGAPSVTASTTEVIIKYKDSNTLEVVNTAPGLSLDTVVENLNNDPSVDYAEPNYERSILTIPTNDTFRGLEWGLDNTGQTIPNHNNVQVPGLVNADINAPEAWALGEGATTTVAVIDVGVDYRHPDIANMMWDGSLCVDENGSSISGGCMYGYDFANNDNNPLPSGLASDDAAFHGTHVSGIIAAEKNNGRGIAGVAPHAQIMALRFFHDDGTARVSDEVRAIDFARENGAKIINASYGGTQFSQAEYDAIKRFTDAGGIFITAAGNSSANNDASHTYPSDYDLPNIISVAATTNTDGLATFSNYGAASVDVGAPGDGIVSLYPDYSGASPAYQYAYANGTSMASPMVAGEAALIWGFDQNLTSTQVRDLIESTGDPLSALSGKTVTGKRIDAYNALLALSTSSSAVLGGLPNATDTSAIPNLNASVSGSNVTAYKYKFDAEDWSATTTASTPISRTSILNGGHSLSVIAENSFGLWQSASSSTDFAWTVNDTTGPDVTGIADDTSGVQSKVWNWSSSDASATFRFEVGTSSVPLTLASSTFSTTTSATAPSDLGTYYLHVQAIDNNGNVGEVKTVSVIIAAPLPAPVSSGGGGSGGGGGGGGGAAPPPALSVTGDSNNDGRVDLLDFNSLMIHWSEHANPLLDFNTLMVHWTT
ncbi:MAG: Alkaline phosphatase [Parcubacteria group bacterium]|nr:Alkaline phosphatase [Parcubacteria group bacterium]